MAQVHDSRGLELSDRAFVTPLVAMKYEPYCNSIWTNVAVALISEPATEEGLARRDSYKLGKIGDYSIIGSSSTLLHSIFGMVVFQYCHVQHTPTVCSAITSSS